MTKTNPNEIHKFLDENSEPNYGFGRLDSKNALVFVELLRKNNLPILGFDGFHRRTDISSHAVQIDQQFSRDFSGKSLEESLRLAEEFFRTLEEKNLIFEMVYPSMFDV